MEEYDHKLRAIYRLHWFMDKLETEPNQAAKAKIRNGLEAYRSAPGRAPPRTTKLDFAHQGVIGPPTIQEVLDEASYYAYGKPFARFPKKRNLVTEGGPVHRWVHGPWRDVQSVRRDGKPHPHRGSLTVNTAMRTYMLRHALRAPTVPAGFSLDTILYRGVILPKDQVQQILSSGVLQDKGYLAFSRSVDFVEEWLGEQEDRRPGSGIRVVFQLRLKDVAHGTPWLWFMSDYLPKNVQSNKKNPGQGVLPHTGHTRAEQAHLEETRGDHGNSDNGREPSHQTIESGPERSTQEGETHRPQGLAGSDDLGGPTWRILCGSQRCDSQDLTRSKELVHGVTGGTHNGSIGHVAGKVPHEGGEHGGVADVAIHDVVYRRKFPSGACNTPNFTLCPLQGMNPLDNRFPCGLHIRGATYHHVTGFLESMRHRGNPEFAEAIRCERSVSIAKEMGDPGTLKWADIDLGKRALTPQELEDYGRCERDYLREALAAKFKRGSWLTKLLLETDVHNNPALAEIQALVRE